MAWIEIKDLSYRGSDGREILSGINLTVAEGAFTVLAGPNGSGKTTLLRHINGLLRPSAGGVTLDGFSVTRHPRRARQFVGMVFQDADTQIVGETVADDVAFGPQNLGLPAGEVDRRVAAALAAVDLEKLADTRPHTLSGGEKRRLAVAGCLAMDARIMVFDEPFTNLDYPGVRQVLAAMVDLHRRGLTVIVATHELEKVLAHADRLVVLSGGRVACEGPPVQVAATIESHGIRRLPADGEWTWLN